MVKQAVEQATIIINLTRPLVNWLTAANDAKGCRGYIHCLCDEALHVSHICVASGDDLHLGLWVLAGSINSEGVPTEGCSMPWDSGIRLALHDKERAKCMSTGQVQKLQSLRNLQSASSVVS